MKIRGAKAGGVCSEPSRDYCCTFRSFSLTLGLEKVFVRDAHLVPAARFAAGILFVPPLVFRGPVRSGICGAGPCLWTCSFLG